ncbi:flagellar biosynthetic protein FliR [Ruegeria halocynthiae]|uniref:Flagellar biosynthetic protein FliR n=1 Tax=Ruegeria halocynthiae TaxID=985054 RepID=A0A1H3DT06_9RHOB|nr:flagellar biosynthetic protein FliR [Ruegeria halocynthiae]SDX69477.1 flagellar biosynthetic protein FliR [Ruegeria halocynthiae]
MITFPAELLPHLGHNLWHLFAVFLRVSAMVSLLPAFGERSIPARVKLGVAVAFTIIIMPAIPSADVLPKFPGMAGMIGVEILIGLLLGIGLRLFVFALQTAGSIAAQATSLSQILGGAATEPVPAMGYLLTLAGLALAMFLGLHVRAAQFMINSYMLFPIGVLPAAPDLSQWGVTQIASSFGLAFALAMPFVIASLIYNLALGVINRAMPQLMVAFVGAPAITFAGLFLLFAGTPLILSTWSDALFSFLQNPLGSVR